MLALKLFFVNKIFFCILREPVPKLINCARNGPSIAGGTVLEGLKARLEPLALGKTK
jgi:hypothetical protein